MKQKRKYYSAYEDRYRRVYAQGVEYWTNDPIEIKDMIDKLNRFLECYKLLPKDTKIIEFGCGEGHLAQYLVETGYKYLGVDLSPSAIKKAKERIGNINANKYFLLGDITHLDGIPDESYDVGIDNQCLQMLIVDDDRRNYLSEIARILVKRGKAYYHEIYQEDVFEGEIKTFDEYIKKFNLDLETLEDREIFTKGQYQKIKLPPVPARFNNEIGYRKELVNAGFMIDNFYVDAQKCVIYAIKNRISCTSANKAYLASCLRHFAQIPRFARNFRYAQPLDAIEFAKFEYEKGGMVL
ncbi:MAG: class I SAM-dependent methyltransferase [Elusimicrobiota bacterium]